MKKIKLGILLFLGGLFLLPYNTYALTGKTEISCSKTTVVPGDIITCTLKGNTSDGVVSAISSNISASANLTLGDVTVDSIWEGTNDAKLDLYTDENKSGTFGIASFTVSISKGVTAGSNESITIGSTKFYDGDYKEVVIADTIQSIKVLSTVNTLSSLAISSGTLSPNFSSSTLNYSATVDAEKVTISATKTDSNSLLGGNIGEVNLNYGVNTFKINVTSQSNAVKTYTLSITRPDNRDTDNTISNLTLNGNKIDLIDDNFEYNYEVEADVNQLEILATLNSNKASFVEGYEPKIVNLVEGENKIELRIKAENETIKTYTLNVYRKSVIVEDGGANNSGTDENDDNKNNGNENIDKSPPTGSLAFYIIVAIVIISIVLGLYYYNMYQKKQVENNNEEK